MIGAKPQEPPAPTDRQIEEAMVAFENAKMRHRLRRVSGVPLPYTVEVLPPMMVETPDLNQPAPPDLSVTVHRFHDERSARQWRERAIICEAITAGLRAAP